MKLLVFTVFVSMLYFVPTPAVSVPRWPDFLQSPAVSVPRWPDFLQSELAKVVKPTTIAQCQAFEKKIESTHESQSAALMQKLEFVREMVGMSCCQGDLDSNFDMVYQSISNPCDFKANREVYDMAVELIRKEFHTKYGDVPHKGKNIVNERKKS